MLCDVCHEEIEPVLNANGDVLVARLRDLKGENNVKIKTPNRREFASGSVGYSSVERSSGT